MFYLEDFLYLIYLRVNLQINQNLCFCLTKWSQRYSIQILYIHWLVYEVKNCIIISGKTKNLRYMEISSNEVA